MDEELLNLALPGLLPEGQTLVIHAKTRMVSLLSLDAGTASIRTQVHFSTNGMAVLLPLLLSYPDYCPYELLLSHLYHLPQEKCRYLVHEAEGDERELMLRPMRRAVVNLAHGLRRLGLEVYSVRGIGYLLKSPIR